MLANVSNANCFKLEYLLCIDNNKNLQKKQTGISIKAMNVFLAL